MSTVVRRPTLSAAISHVKILYFGPPGTGKTADAASLARLGRIVVVDAEGGLKRQPLEALGIPIENIELHTDIQFESIMDLLQELRAELTLDEDAYAGVALDSLSEIQRRYLDQRASRQFKLSQGDYGENTFMMRRQVRAALNLPTHVAVTAHGRRDEDDDGEVNYRPSLTPSVASDLLGLVDLVCYTRVTTLPESNEVAYVGCFQPGRKFVAKDRFGLLPPCLVSPTLDRVLSYTSGQFTREAVRAALDGDVRDDLDPLQFDYIKQLKSSKSLKTGE